MDGQAVTFGIAGIVYLLIKLVEKLVIKIISSREQGGEKTSESSVSRRIDAINTSNTQSFSSVHREINNISSKLETLGTSVTALKQLHDPNINEMIRALYDWHDKNDQDGVKLWYVPRSWYVVLRDVVDTTATVNTTQNQLISQLSKLADRIENIEREVMVSNRKSGKP
jgi:hypothetical protein